MNDMSFEQIKAITEKYGPVLEQLDRLHTGGNTYHAEYMFYLEKMKLAASDQFANEVKSLLGRPSDEQRALAGSREK